MMQNLAATLFKNKNFTPHLVAFDAPSRSGLAERGLSSQKIQQAKALLDTADTAGLC
jgi:hypothetical protein